jgi:hypothetical protein
MLFCQKVNHRNDIEVHFDYIDKSNYPRKQD